MNNHLKILIIVISFAFSLFGAYSAIRYSLRFWFTLFIIPAYILVASINNTLKNKTTLRANLRNFLKLYSLYFIVGGSIEFVGYFLFKFWYFPEITPLGYLLNVLIIGYPMPLLVLSEFFNFSYYFIRKLSNSLSLKIILSMIISTFVVSVISEYPNIFAYEWVYQNLPFTGILIFGTDLLIIVGWIILTYFSVFVLSSLKIKNTTWLMTDVKERKESRE